MRNFFKLWMIAVILPGLVLTSCKKDDNNDGPVQSEFEILTQYMADQNLDLPDLLNGWVTSGSALTLDNDFAVQGYYVIDIRSAVDFAEGHIKNAVNSTLANVLNEAENANGQPILVVCYTGQNAARAVGALRMMGFNAKSLKWGMSAWHQAFQGKWNSNATDLAHTNWVTTGAPPANVTFDARPTFFTGASNGADILEAKVKALLNNSNWTATKTAVLDNPGNYFINNKWSQASWDEFGHVNGAFRIDEDLNLNGLRFLDPVNPVVTYCYTGQTSSITTAWLEVLGYNAKSLMFGANGIVYTALVNSSSNAKVSWKGAGSGSELNFGYYNSNGDFFGPSPN